jgi:hypothetical protein
MLARALNMQDRPDEARGLLQRALAIRERVYGDAHPAWRRTVNDLERSRSSPKRYDEAAAPSPGWRRSIARSTGGTSTTWSGSRSRTWERASGGVATRRRRAAVPASAGDLRDDVAPDHGTSGSRASSWERALLAPGRHAPGERPRHWSGYELLRKQNEPERELAAEAREDLVEEQRRCGSRADAGRFRAELAATR